MLYGSFGRLYPFMGLNTQPDPSFQNVLFEVPRPQNGGGGHTEDNGEADIKKDSAE